MINKIFASRILENFLEGRNSWNAKKWLKEELTRRVKANPICNPPTTFLWNLSHFHRSTEDFWPRCIGIKEALFLPPFIESSDSKPEKICCLSWRKNEAQLKSSVWERRGKRKHWIDRLPIPLFLLSFRSIAKSIYSPVVVQPFIRFPFNNCQGRKCE